MKKGIRKEAVAIVLARLTNEKVAINNGDISSLISSIQAISKQMFDLNNALFEANKNIAALEESIAITNGNIEAIERSLSSTNDNTTALERSIALADSNIETLKNRFDGHTHSYGDIDNLAVLINKTTSAPQ